MSQQPNILVIYTLEDGAVMQRIAKRLKSSEKDAGISIWSDNPILPGQLWKPQNESRFGQTDIFILLVSNTFMYSQFIQQLEFKMVIDRYKVGKSRVIPIIIDKCPWDIDFRSDDYNFNLNELGVLPHEGKPVKEWDSSERVYDAIAKEIKAVIRSVPGNDIQERPKVDEEGKPADVKEEEQIEIPFGKEKEAQEEKRKKEEVEAKRIAEENKAREEAKTKKRAEEKQKLQKEAASNRRAEEQRQREVAESKKRAEEQKQKEKVESLRSEEQKRLKKEAERKKQVEETRRIKEGNRQESVAVSNEKNGETPQENAPGQKKTLLIGLSVAVLAIIAIWNFNSGDDKEAEPSLNTKTTEVEDSIPLEKTEIEPVEEEESLPELVIGDYYDSGIVFTIGSDGKTGKIVHIDDAGPMPWADAMIIHNQLGKGWRLPTLDELKVLYNTLGQGASNSAEFADKLYWSATPYDDFQARLLQFRTGSTSFHYNKKAEHRKFLVRAVRDFSR